MVVHSSFLFHLFISGRLFRKVVSIPQAFNGLHQALAILRVNLLPILLARLQRKAGHRNLHHPLPFRNELVGSLHTRVRTVGGHVSRVRKRFPRTNGGLLAFRSSQPRPFGYVLVRVSYTPHTRKQLHWPL